jgi:Mn2+/Fe2+ NRAMP family transporter
VRAIGPGLVAGASDTDPTTVAAIAVIGATTVFGLAWLALLVAPGLIVVQVLASRVGVLGRADLQSAARQRFGRGTRQLLLLSIVVVTVLTLAADLEAGAASIDLLTGAPTGWLVAPLAAVVVALLVLGTYPVIQRALKYGALALFAYVGSAFLTHVPWGQVLHHSFVPTFSFTHDDIAGALALLGTTITSYVYVWQSIELAEERPRPRWLRPVETDAAIGIVFAVAIIWFILVATGATLGAHHQPVQTAQDAARALAPLAGSDASTLFGLGLLASALVAVPVLMSTAAYVVGAEFGWRRGLSEPVSRAPRFYASIAVATAAALVVTVSSVSAIRLLFYASIAGGLGAPIGLACLVLVAGDRHVMHGRPVGAPMQVAGWVVAIVISLLGLLYIVDEVVGGL